MYLTLFDSYVLWLESYQRLSYARAVFSAGLAFSFFAFITLVSATLLLDLFAGIPVVSWIDDHRWSIWAAMALVAAPHWLVARKAGSRGMTEAGSFRGPSRLLWLWYFIPVLALFVATAVVALVRATPPY